MKKIISSNSAPKAIGAYSQAITCNNLIYTSGQIPINPTTGKLVKDDIRLEILQIMDNLSAILQEGGSSLENVIKFTIYLTDLSLFTDLNNIFVELFNENYPARTTIEVSGLPKGARVEIDAIAVIL